MSIAPGACLLAALRLLVGRLVRGVGVRPIPITRFMSFRTQPLDNFSAVLSNNSFWATQPLEQILSNKYCEGKS